MSKRCALEELSAAVLAVCEGERYLSKDVRRPMAVDRSNNHTGPLNVLTRREFEVFLCMARGDTMIDLASKLNISPKTGYVYRGKIMSKLNITKLADLIQLVHSHKLI